MNQDVQAALLACQTIASNDGPGAVTLTALRAALAPIRFDASLARFVVADRSPATLVRGIQAWGGARATEGMDDPILSLVCEALDRAWMAGDTARTLDPRLSAVISAIDPGGAASQAAEEGAPGFWFCDHPPAALASGDWQHAVQLTLSATLAGGQLCACGEEVPQSEFLALDGMMPALVVAAALRMPPGSLRCTLCRDPLGLLGYSISSLSGDTLLLAAAASEALASGLEAADHQGRRDAGPLVETFSTWLGTFGLDRSFLASHPAG